HHICPHRLASPLLSPFFLFNAPSPTEIYTLSLHDALPIYHPPGRDRAAGRGRGYYHHGRAADDTQRKLAPERLDLCGHPRSRPRSEEHTSELQSRFDLVCRLLLEKKKKKPKKYNNLSTNTT